VLLGLCNFSTFGRVVVIFVTVVTAHFGLLFLPSITYTYTNGKRSVSTATVGAGPFVRQILSKFSRRIRYKIADL
jgi:hypothetical protein